jgi:hypothetical protein
MGHAASAAHGRPASYQHPQHLIAALARLAEAGETLHRRALVKEGDRPPESGLPISFDLVRVAEALLVFFFFLTLHTTVFMRSFQVTKHDHFNVS